MKRNSSNVWPYVIAGSAIGGAVGYLFMTGSGRKIRHTVTHTHELADTIEDARCFIESKAKMVTAEVRGAIDKAKHGLEEGQRAYREAEQSYLISASPTRRQEQRDYNQRSRNRG